MRPVLVTAVFAATVAALAALGVHGRPTALPPSVRPAASGSPFGPSQCPAGSLPDNGVCIPVPAPERAVSPPRAAERIPRRPDRPPEYTRYALPVARALSVVELGGEGAPDGGAGPSGVAIETEPGSGVTAVALDGQDGPARVLFAGRLFGPTVITLHTVRASGLVQQYLVALGRLESTRPVAGESVSAGATLGYAGAALLILETRLVRPGVDPRALSATRLLDEANSVATDPRNVLGAPAP